jgi:hypothetical protein
VRSICTSKPPLAQLATFSAANESAESTRCSLFTIAPDNITGSAAQLQFPLQRVPKSTPKPGRFRLTVAGSRGMDGRVKKTMRIFTIDAGNIIAVSTSTEQRSSTSGAARFTNEKQLAALAAHWPSGRLVEIWNNLPGVRQIAKFTDRQTGLRRIWAAIHGLKPHVGAHAASGGDKTSSRGKTASPSVEPGPRQYQDGARDCASETAFRRHAQNHHVPYRLAVPQRARLYQRSAR